MSLQKLLLTIALMFLLLGCSASPQTVDQSTKVDISKLDESQAPTLPEETGTKSPDTFIPGTSQTHPTQTPTETSDAITLPIRSVTEKCMSIEPSLPPGFLSDGLLIIGDFTEKPGVAKLSRLYGPTEERILMDDLPPYIWGEVSPNLFYLMYDHSVGSSEFQTSVVASDGSILSSFLVDDEWSSGHWVDDHRVVFSRVHGSPTSVDIIDVASGERKRFAPDLPYFFDGYPGESWGYWKFVYDPTMTRVAYKQENIEGVPEFVLWNLETEEEMYRLKKYSVHFTTPVWAPDGSRIAVVAMNHMEDDFDRFELFIIGYDGHGSQWIDVKGYFPDELTVRIKWSPDSRYIAIMGIMEQSSFLVLDTSSKQLLEYCIKGGHHNNPLLWSPDSSQVILPVWEAPSILIDLEREVGTPLVQDYHFVPLAWLANGD